MEIVVLIIVGLLLFGPVMELLGVVAQFLAALMIAAVILVLIGLGCDGLKALRHRRREGKHA